MIPHNLRETLILAHFHGNLCAVKHTLPEKHWLLNELYLIIAYLSCVVEIVQDQIENNRESENLKYYLSLIPERFHKNLDDEIDDEILSKTAESLTGWIYKYDLLELNHNEMEGIKFDNDSAESQR